jgi:L-alanine-DL-glutamate epimerase-like enolase superfamily enzyme
VRAYFTGWYTEIVADLPKVEDGRVSPLDGPGLGLALKPEVFERPDAEIRLTGDRSVSP